MDPVYETLWCGCHRPRVPDLSPPFHGGEGRNYWPVVSGPGAGGRARGGGAHGWPVAVWEQHARAMSQLERRSTGVYLKLKDACI